MYYCVINYCYKLSLLIANLLVKLLQTGDKFVLSNSTVICRARFARITKFELDISSLF